MMGVRGEARGACSPELTSSQTSRHAVPTASTGVFSVFFNIAGGGSLYQRAEMVQVPGSCDSAAEEGDALANMSVCATHDGDGRADGGENRHDELNDVLNSLFLHGVKIKGF